MTNKFSADRKLKLAGVLLAVCLIYGCHPAAADQASANPEANPYFQLSNQELAARARAFAKSLHALNVELRQAFAQSPAHAPHATGGTKVDLVQGKYDKDFAAQARNLEQEFLRRIPAGAKPKDNQAEIASLLIKSGRLAGADPADVMASYIEQLAAKLDSIPTSTK
jgi:hypothetical protein